MAEVKPMGTDNTLNQSSDDKARLKANEAAVKAHDAVVDASHEEMKKDRAERIKNNDAKIAFDAKQRPTPTVDEMIAVNAGKNPLQKEPSGGVPQDPTDPPHTFLDPHLRKAGADGKYAPYQTRDAGPATNK